MKYFKQHFYWVMRYAQDANLVKISPIMSFSWLLFCWPSTHLCLRWDSFLLDLKESGNF